MTVSPSWCCSIWGQRHVPSSVKNEAIHIIKRPPESAHSPLISHLPLGQNINRSWHFESFPLRRFRFQEQLSFSVLPCLYSFPPSNVMMTWMWCMRRSMQCWIFSWGRSLHAFDQACLHILSWGVPWEVVCCFGHGHAGSMALRSGVSWPVQWSSVTRAGHMYTLGSSGDELVQHLQAQGYLDVLPCILLQMEWALEGESPGENPNH